MGVPEMFMLRGNFLNCCHGSELTRVLKVNKAVKIFKTNLKTYLFSKTMTI